MDEDETDFGYLTPADVEMMRWATTVRVEEPDFSKFWIDDDG